MVLGNVQRLEIVKVVLDKRTAAKGEVERREIRNDTFHCEHNGVARALQRGAEQGQIELFGGELARQFLRAQELFFGRERLLNLGFENIEFFCFVLFCLAVKLLEHAKELGNAAFFAKGFDPNLFKFLRALCKLNCFECIVLDHSRPLNAQMLGQSTLNFNATTR